MVDLTATASDEYPGEYDTPPTFDDELIPEDPAAPSLGIINRYREVARLNAMGWTNNAICAHLGYTPSRLSVILHDPFIQSEVRKWRDRMVDEDAIGILKQASTDAAQLIHRKILNPRTKDTVAMDAAKFAIEKTHGKARQEVSVESGSLNMFTEMLKQMRSNGEMLDVTPTPAAAGPSDSQPNPHIAERNVYDAWLDKELA